MKKLLYFVMLCCCCSLIVAFRLKTDNEKNLAATKRIEALRKQYSISCMAVLSPDMANAEIGPLTGWGDYRWKITATNDSVQYYFDQGINMYYAYHIIEAKASFNKAIRFDSTCAMAWYGKGLAAGFSIKLSKKGPLPKDAVAAAQKSAQYAASCNALEKSLISALSLRYTGDSSGGIAGMMDRYVEAMSAVAKNNADNADALTLYADALSRRYLGKMYEDDLTPKPWTNTIKNSLQQAIAISPRHPGAHHILIHILQGSARPEEALHSAEILPSLMPGMAHMVHMPSHVYLRTGYYQKGIAANNDAIAAYENTAKEFTPAAENKPFYSTHPRHVNANCAIMNGNYAVANAAALVVKTETFPLLSIPPPFGNYMQYAYQIKIFSDVRFGKWEELLKEEPIDTLPYAALLSHFGRGIAQARLHNLSEADRELQLLETNLASPALKMEDYEIEAMYEPGTIAQDILKGVIATERRQYAAAIEALERASITDDSLSYNEPRYWVLPARHYLGDVYLKMKNYKKAVEVFNKDLELNPLNIWSLNGLLIAYTATNNTAGVNATKKKIKSTVRHTDIVRPVF